MISIKNKEKEQCNVRLVDIGGMVHYETNMDPHTSMDLDLATFSTGIYFLVFCTQHTSFIQELIKY